MGREILISECEEVFHWYVANDNEVCATGVENDCFQAFKKAKAAFDRAKGE